MCVCYFQELLKDIKQKENALDKLSRQYSRLSPERGEVGADMMRPLRRSWEDLVGQLEDHLRSRSEFVGQCEAYHRQHNDLSNVAQELRQRVDGVHSSHDLTLQNRIQQLQVSLACSVYNDPADNTFTQCCFNPYNAELFCRNH